MESSKKVSIFGVLSLWSGLPVPASHSEHSQLPSSLLFFPDHLLPFCPQACPHLSFLSGLWNSLRIGGHRLWRQTVLSFHPQPWSSCVCEQFILPLNLTVCKRKGFIIGISLRVWGVSEVIYKVPDTGPGPQIQINN